MGLLKWLDREDVRTRIKEFVRPVYRLFRNKKVNFVLKLVIVALLFYAIYQQVFAKENVDELWDAFVSRFDWEHAHWIIIAFILMPINWGLETLKWQVLVRRVEEVPFLRAFKGIFLGIALSVFTPNRIGEYGGRILVVKPENNWRTVVATLVSSFSQLVALLSLGMVGFVYFSNAYLSVEGYLAAGTALLGVSLILLMLISYYNVNLAIPIFKKIPYLRRFVKHMEVLEDYTARELSYSLFYAILRYGVYTLQYYLILRFFDINAPFIAGVSGIATIFLLQTSVPLPAVADLFVRSEVALYIWGFFGDNDINILASTFGLWILNIIIPALLGMVFILTVNITRSLGVKDETEKESETN